MPCIASYNIRKCVGLDWKRNPSRIQSVIAELNADIVLLQEVDKRLGKRESTLSTNRLYEEQDYQLVEMTHSSVSHGWHGNAILYKKSISLLDSQTIKLPSLEPRGALLAVFQFPNQQKVQIIGTHLSLIKSYRTKQINFLIKHYGQNKGDLPIIIGGDLNEKNADHWFTNNQQQMNNYRLITPGNSFHSKYPKLAFDRFIINPYIDVISTHVHNTPLAKKASDHLPVFAHFFFK